MLFQEHQMSAAESSTLSERLNHFYGTTESYTAFHVASQQSHCWTHLKQDILKLASLGRPVRLLEVGAGKSGFADWVNSEGLRTAVHLSAQDVTEQNAVWLKQKFDDVYIGGLQDVFGAGSHFDIVFSTYVLEHVVNPQRHLAKLFSLLSSAGSLFIFCPRYDVPGYLPPSTRHLSPLARAKLVASVLLTRARSVLLGRPAFIIQTDLAVFHRPFFTDADACHWVSMFDLRRWAKQRNATFSCIDFGAAGGLKQWIVWRFLTCGAKISRAAV